MNFVNLLYKSPMVKTGTMVNMQLKLIGVQIHKDCASHIRKKLKADVFYYLYNEYKYADRFPYVKRESCVISDDFFTRSLTTDMQISISAVVGKNGDGKSAIADIVMRLINNLSYKCADSSLYKLSPQWIPGVRAFMIYMIGSDFYKLEQTSDEVSDIQLYKLNYNEECWQKVEIDKQTLESSTFYTVILNYSLHAFNSFDYTKEWEHEHHNKDDKEAGSWIKAVSHKNDGYQIPLVINPMRTEGNIDINTESHLTQDRLMSLLFNKDGEENSNFTRINNHLHISSIKLSLAEKSVSGKYKKIIDNWEENLERKIKYLWKLNKYNPDDDIFRRLNGLIIGCWRSIYHFKPQENNDIEYNLAIKYLVYKTISVAQKYDVFDHRYALNINYKDEWDRRRTHLKQLINEIDRDRSHITFRIRQTLAFLVNRHLKQEHYTVDQFAELARDVLQKEQTKDHKWSLYELVPPPCFDVELFVRDDNNDKGEFPFAQLSSGERQMVYTTSTVLYHIRNINSIELSSYRVKYRHINLIMDEIELYYHPEYQKRFVKHLLDSLASMSFKDIRSINVILITHSPFILSDIPKQNVLFLKDGRPYNEMQENTFGANIHSLLQNGFFMEDGTIGDFAKERINCMFGMLHSGEPLPDNMREEIMLVSEPFIRSQLLCMYNEQQPEYKEIESLRTQVRRLNSLLEDMMRYNNKWNNNNNDKD